MKVCYVIHPYTYRKDLGLGHDRYAYEILTRAPKYGVNPEVFESGLIKTIPGALAAEVFAIGRLLARKKNTSALYHATATANAMAPISSRTSPLLTTIHDVLWFFVGANYDSAIKYHLKTRAIKRAALKSDGVIVPFQSTKDFLVNELGAKPDRIFNVPYGVDDQQFYPLAPGENLPKPDFFPKNSKVVLFIGALNFGKGIDTLLKCFPQVVEKHKDARLLVGSSGWDTEFVKSIWQNSPVKDHIIFSGFIPENQLRAAYIHADVTVFPSRYGFGLSTLESMACGTATVSGRVLDAPEFIGDAGLMADPNSPDELAHQINRVLGDDTLRHDLEQKGLIKSRPYRWEQTAKLTVDVYRKMLS